MDGVLHSGCGSRPAAWFTGIVALMIFGSLGGALALWGPAFVVPIGVVLVLLALGSVPWQLHEAGSRRHWLTNHGLRCRSGVIGRFEVEVPYHAIRGITVRQGIWQRPLGCADVRVAAPGMSGPVLISPRDYNSVVLRSIADFEVVARTIRERMAAPEA